MKIRVVYQDDTDGFQGTNEQDETYQRGQAMAVASSLACIVGSMSSGRAQVWVEEYSDELGQFSKVVQVQVQ